MFSQERQERYTALWQWCVLREQNTSLTLYANQGIYLRQRMKKRVFALSHFSKSPKALEYRLYTLFAE